MGGETPYVAYAIIALVVIIFGVLVGFSFKVWRVLHGLLAIAVFISLGFFIVFAAAMLKTQTAWKVVQEDLALQVAQRDAELQELLVGLPGTSDEAIASQNRSLRNVEQEVSRVLIGRGLVWRGMLREGVDTTGDGYVSVVLNATYWGDQACIAPGVQAAPAQPAAPVEEQPVEGEEPAEAPAEEADDTLTVRRHGLEPGMLVFAYQEQPATNLNLPGLSNLCRVPQVYLGQFRVEQCEPDSPRIELVSVLPSDEILPGMLQTIQQPGQGISWTLYQSLPSDRHDVFLAMSDEQIRTLIPNDSVEEYLNHLEPIPADYDPDNLPAGAEPIPTENIWARVRFTKPYTMQVDVPAPAEGEAPPPAAAGEVAGDGARKDFRYFDEQGMAIFPSLRQSGDGSLAFEPGSEIVIPTLAANELVEEGVVEQVEQVYVRPLRQYQILMTGIRIGRQRDLDKIAVLETDIARQTLAVTQAEEQQGAREALISDLEFDVEGFQAEIEVLAAVKSRLDNDYANFREQYRQLYLNVKARAAELNRIHAEILQRLESGEPEPNAAEPSTDLASAEAAR